MLCTSFEWSTGCRPDAQSFGRQRPRLEAVACSRATLTTLGADSIHIGGPFCALVIRRGMVKTVANRVQHAKTT